MIRRQTILRLAAVIAFGGLLVTVENQVSAHPGGLDKNGGHTDRKTGTYHFHGGNSSGGSSSGSGSSSSSSSSSAVRPGCSGDPGCANPLVASQPAIEPTAAATISVVNSQFSPSKVALKKGGIVTIINTDATSHSFSPVVDGSFIGIETIHASGTATVSFDVVGDHGFRCNFHDNMTGTVTVTE